MTITLKPLGDRVVAKPKPKDQGFLDKVVANFKGRITHEAEVLQGVLRERLAAAPAVEEPPLPAPPERFATASAPI